MNWEGLKKAKVFGHVDGNNFYCSCETNFDSSLIGKPVVVLTNNDLCIISRSQEAKDLGIEMGQPVFQVKDFLQKHNVIMRSSNYTLYADMSRRFHQILKGFTPHQEIYSIDESFLDFTGFRTHDLQKLGQEMRQRCRQWIGLPVCVGFGYSKTQAKFADFLAKKRPEYNGVCDLTTLTDEEIDAIYASVRVKEVWGIGDRLELKLNSFGIHTALDLKNADPEYMRQQFSVVVEKTIRELNHISCIELEEMAPSRKAIMSSKSFGTEVFDIVELQEAVTQYMAEATGKLRRDGSLTSKIEVFIMTSQYIPEDERFHKGMKIPLPAPTDDTLRLTNVALWALKRIYQPGYRYQKAGVLLDGLVPKTGSQGDLFAWQSPISKTTKLMTVMDSLNTKYGRGTVRPASQGYNKRWQMRRNLKSNHFTTQWEELPVIRI